MKILIAGDYFPGCVEDSSNIKKALECITFLCSNVDYSIVNYESPISSEYDSPINKCGPCLKSNKGAAYGLKQIGFDCVTLANNHVLDQGEKTLLHTIKTCEDLGFDIVGAGKDLEEAGNILYKTIEGKTLAIINCCEHEFSIATENSAGSNPLNPVQQFYAIQEAKKKADYVLVIVHGGHEHYQLPSPRMQESYRFFIDVGADAVVNHHQHCYSGYELYNGKPIFYGLGNFIFPENNSTKIWNEGYMVRLEFGNGEVKFRLIPYEQDKNAGIKLMDINAEESFRQTIASLNKSITDPQLLKTKHAQWMEDTKARYESLLYPIKNRYINALQRRRWLPSMISRKVVLRWINYIDCEAHRDRLIHMMRSKI